MRTEKLDEFRCCLSDDKHFIIQPIILTKCGHSACKDCFSKDNQTFFKCKICEVVSEFEFTVPQVSAALKIAIKFMYDKMFQALENETRSKINDLKSNVLFSIHLNIYQYLAIKGLSQNQNDLLDLKIKYIEDEIDIRIESVKDQLELTRDNLRNELSRMKMEVKK